MEPIEEEKSSVIFTSEKMESENPDKKIKTIADKMTDKEIIAEKINEIKEIKKAHKTTFAEMRRTHAQKADEKQRKHDFTIANFKKEYTIKEDEFFKQRDELKQKEDELIEFQHNLDLVKKKLDQEISNLSCEESKETMESYLVRLFEDIKKSMNIEEELVQMSETERRIKDYEIKLMGEPPASGFNPDTIDLAYIDSTTPPMQDIALVSCVSLPDTEIRKHEIIKMMSFVKMVICKEYQIPYEEFLWKYILFLQKHEAEIIKEWKKEAPLMAFEHIFKVRSVCSLKDKRGNPIEKAEEKIDKEISGHISSDPHHLSILKTEVGWFTPFTSKPELYTTVQGVESDVLIEDPIRSYNRILAGQKKQRDMIKKSFDERIIDIYRSTSAKHSESIEYGHRKKKAMLEGREFTDPKPVIVKDPKREMADIFLLDEGVRDITFHDEEKEHDLEEQKELLGE